MKILKIIKLSMLGVLLYTQAVQCDSTSISVKNELSDQRSLLLNYDFPGIKGPFGAVILPPKKFSEELAYGQTMPHVPVGAIITIKDDPNAGSVTFIDSGKCPGNEAWCAQDIKSGKLNSICGQGSGGRVLRCTIVYQQ